MTLSETDALDMFNFLEGDDPHRHSHMSQISERLDEGMQEGFYSDSDLHKVLELFDLLVYCALLLYILMEDLTEYLV